MKFNLHEKFKTIKKLNQIIIVILLEQLMIQPNIYFNNDVQLNGFSLDSAKTECEDLGFKKGQRNLESVF